MGHFYNGNDIHWIFDEGSDYEHDLDHLVLIQGFLSYDGIQLKA